MDSPVYSCNQFSLAAKSKNSLKETVLEGGCMLPLLLSKASISPLLCMEHPKGRMCPSIKNGTSEGEGSSQIPLVSEIIPLKSPRESWGVTSEE